MALMFVAFLTVVNSVIGTAIAIDRDATGRLARDTLRPDREQRLPLRARNRDRAAESWVVIGNLILGLALLF